MPNVLWFQLMMLMSSSTYAEMCFKSVTSSSLVWYINRFLLSGADVISTATYQASIPGFISHLDVSSERARELLMSGVQLAKETVERFVSDSRPAGTNTHALWYFLCSLWCYVILFPLFISQGQRCPLVAGSVGPYGAFLHDGSEYTGAYAEEMSVEVSGSRLLIMVTSDTIMHAVWKW